MEDTEENQETVQEIPRDPDIEDKRKLIFILEQA
jgi:hypothetical protein